MKQLPPRGLFLWLFLSIFTENISGMAKKKTKERVNDTAFTTSGASIDSIENLIEKELGSISFDAHFVTAKTMQFGKLLTGIPLYSYQEMIAYRIIYAVLTLENTTITMLLSRQCIAEGSLVYSRDGSLCKIEEHPDSWLTDVNRLVYKVVVQGGYTLYCTDNHPLLATTKLNAKKSTTIGDWKQTKELKKGDWVQVLKNDTRWGNDIIPYSYSKYVNMHRTDTVTGESTMNEELAELLGWLTADGYVNAGGQSVKFTNVNADYLQRVTYLVTKYFKDIIVKRYAKGNGYDLTFTTGSKNRSNSLKDWITTMQFSDKFPLALRYFSKKSVSAFFKGMYPADGYCSLKGKSYECGLSCGNNLTYAKYVREYLNKLGIQANLKSEKMAKNLDGTKFNRVVFTGSLNAKTFLDTVGEIRGKQSPFYTKEQYSVRHTRAEFVGEDSETLEYRPIVSITESHYTNVWDMEVPDKHWFICDGVKVHNSGKSETLAFVVNTLSTLLPALATVFEDLDQFKLGIKIGLFAPQADQVFTTYNRALLRLDNENAEMVLGDPDLNVELTKPTKYELTNGSYMMGQVASKQSKIESKTYDLILLEEAQDLDTTLVQKSIEPMVSAVGGTIIKCGTTGTSKSDFWQEIQYNIKRSVQIADGRLKYHLEFNHKMIFKSKREQFAIDGKKFHLLYERDVEAKEKKWGRDATPFRLGYALEWDLDSGMLISDKLFKKVCNRRKGLGVFDEDTDIMVAGLDIGKDQSSTIVTIGKVIFNPIDDLGDQDIKKELVDWMELHKVDYETQFNEVVDFLLEYNVSAVTCDYTGVGKPFVDRLRAAVGDVIHIIEYPFSTSSKSDLWLNLLSYFETGRFILPANAQAQKTETWDRFKEQLLNMQKWYNGAYLCAEKGDGYQDDYIDSLALMLMTDGFEVQEFIEEEASNPFFDTFAMQQQIIDSRYQ